jgi:arylsulfatase A-like enzyme
VSPQKIGRLCSQIDLPPTLLGLLGWTYESRFYGKDVFHMKTSDERAFIATYQKLGYLRSGMMAVLEPVRRHKQFSYELPEGEVEPMAEDDDFLAEGIASYETASYLFSHGLNRAPEVK